jgi:hypothetical protein
MPISLVSIRIDIINLCRDYNMMRPLTLNQAIKSKAKTLIRAAVPRVLNTSNTDHHLSYENNPRSSAPSDAVKMYKELMRVPVWLFQVRDKYKPSLASTLASLAAPLAFYHSLAKAASYLLPKSLSGVATDAAYLLQSSVGLHAGAFFRPEKPTETAMAHLLYYMSTAPPEFWVMKDTLDLRPGDHIISDHTHKIYVGLGMVVEQTDAGVIVMRPLVPEGDVKGSHNIKVRSYHDGDIRDTDRQNIVVATLSLVGGRFNVRDCERFATTVSTGAKQDFCSLPTTKFLWANAIYITAPLLKLAVQKGLEFTGGEKLSEPVQLVLLQIAKSIASAFFDIFKKKEDDVFFNAHNGFKRSHWEEAAQAAQASSRAALRAAATLENDIRNIRAPANPRSLARSLARSRQADAPASTYRSPRPSRSTRFA